MAAGSDNTSGTGRPGVERGGVEGAGEGERPDHLVPAKRRVRQERVFPGQGLGGGLNRSTGTMYYSNNRSIQQN